jgi:PHS family inorganic phosphate transporter-like MFS transporter
MSIFALFMFLGMLTSLLVPESKQARLEALAGEKEDVYALQASGWRSRRAGGDAETGTSRASGSARSEEGILEGDKGKWWRVRQGEIHGQAV